MTKQEQPRSRPELQLEAELLVRAALLIQTPQTWTRRALARDKHSHPVSPTSKSAVRYCVGGALFRAAAERFGFELRVTKANPASVFPAELAAAFRRFGETMTTLLFANFVVKFSEEDPMRVFLHLRDDGEVIEETTWHELAYTLNDNKMVNHAKVLLCLNGAIATALADQRGDDSFDIWKWVLTLGKESISQTSDGPEQR